jgi:hypothetical protein
LRIRRQQIEAFQHELDRRLAPQIADYLREHHARCILGIAEPTLDARILRGIARARAHGLSTDAALAWFVALTFEVAPGFDRQPAIRAALRDASVRDEDRVAHVMDKVGPEAWDAAAAFTDGEA